MNTLYSSLDSKPSRFYIRQSNIKRKYNESKSIDSPHYSLYFLFGYLLVNNSVEKLTSIQYRQRKHVDNSDEK